MKLAKVLQFLAGAEALAETFSKDPSTKVGAVVVDPADFTQLTEGYNGMPRGMDESKPERHERPLKYAFYEHAERNAIYNAVRPKLNGSIAVTTEFPSVSCVRALLAVGAREVVLPRPVAQEGSRRQAEEALALGLLREAGVTLWFAQDLERGQRHQRKLAQNWDYALKYASINCKDPQPAATFFVAPEEYTRIASGYSGLPRGGQDNKPERYLGENRDLWVESSVRNAIYNSARPLLKGGVALVTATTCVECARALASAGVSRVYYRKPSADFQNRWGTSISAALQLLDELGVGHHGVTQNE